MDFQLSRRALPTLESCPYREAVGPSTDGDEVATCRLLTLVSGVREEVLCRVATGVCQQCCKSFPASPERWNPVIASLVYRLACQVRDRGGVEGCDQNRSAELLRQAAETLDIRHGDEQRVEPARDRQVCCYRADPLPSPPRGSEGEAFRCEHPEHPFASKSRCRRCRDWSPRRPRSRPLSLAELVPPFGRRSGTPVRRWAVGVTTAPRRQPTLEATLDGLTRAGWDHAHLFVDGPIRLPPRFSHLPVTWRERPLGVWQSWYAALMELVMSAPDADAIMLLQDDAALHDRHDLRAYLEGCLWPGEEPGVVSLYYAGTCHEPGWQRFTGPWSCGPVAMIFPTAVARAFLNDPLVVEQRWNKSDPRWPSLDFLIADWAAQTGVGVWFPTPSLVQHLGNTSTVWQDAPNQAYRRAACFSADVDVPFAAGESFDHFPERRFAPVDSLAESYRMTVKRGRQRIARTGVVICGLCRDVRHHLPRFAERVERLGAMFGDYRVVLFENDSRDATGEFLRDWAEQNARLYVLSERLEVERFPSVRSLERARFLAACRNRYRDHVLEHLADFPFVLVVDADLHGGWSLDGICHSFGSDGWDFVGSSGLLRRPVARPDHSPYVQFDSWAYRPRAAQPGAPTERDFPVWIPARGEPLLPVDSCFGGLGIYRTEAFRVARYHGEDQEHVAFHQRMRDAGLNRLFLNPSQIVLYG